MAEKVAKAGVKREDGFLYFVNKDGNIARTKMARGKQDKGKSKAEVVAKTNVQKEKGYLYFMDKQGDVSRAKMAKGRK